MSEPTDKEKEDLIRGLREQEERFNKSEEVPPTPTQLKEWKEIEERRDREFDQLKIPYLLLFCYLTYQCFIISGSPHIVGRLIGSFFQSGIILFPLFFMCLVGQNSIRVFFLFFFMVLNLVLPNFLYTFFRFSKLEKKIDDSFDDHLDRWIFSCMGMSVIFISSTKILSTI